jgi:Trypsin-like peptidase domain
VMRNGFFAIFSEKNGIKEYLRYHQDGAGLLGFTTFWRNDDAPLYGGRIMTFVSGSLSNQMLGTLMIPVPKLDDVRNNYEQPPAPVTPPEDRSTAPAPSAKPRVSVSSGSGFFVSDEGHVLTNNHVVEDCTSFRVFMDQAAAADARVIARDASNDLALLSTALKPLRTASPQTNVRLGESVAAFGYPHADVLASSGNFTLGNVTPLRGSATTLATCKYPRQSRLAIAAAPYSIRMETSWDRDRQIKRIENRRGKRRPPTECKLRVEGVDRGQFSGHEPDQIRSRLFYCCLETRGSRGSGQVHERIHSVQVSPLLAVFSARRRTPPPRRALNSQSRQPLFALGNFMT